MEKFYPAIKVLKNNGVAVIPTDTIYGLVASALKPEAVERVYRLKNRAGDKPCIILINALADLKKFGLAPTKTDLTLINKLWPGPVSIIFPLPKAVAQALTYLHRGTETLAFRLPKPLTLRNLLKKTGPLIAPSANPEDARPARTIIMARRYFGDGVDCYIAGGKKLGKPSRLVALHSGKIITIRV